MNSKIKDKRKYILNKVEAIINGFDYKKLEYFEDYFEKNLCEVEGIAKTDRGVNLARFGTALGDGFYYDYENNEYGVDAGNTFDGAIAMNSSSWMYFPTGRTEERSRGRAVIGWANNPVDNGMDVFDIHSSGNSTEFGNLTSGNRWGSHAFSSTTRGLWAGGYVNTPASTFFNTIDFVTIATNGNPIDFGDTTTASYRSGCCSSSTRGIIALGFVAPAFGKVIFAGCGLF